ncbi:MAG: hypothetical protein M1546_16200 [Chloroflexi bacterium]|nr:hypothetical protein [Chloroflexota bacterium]
MTTPNDRSNKSNSEWASSRGPSVYAVGDGTGNGNFSFNNTFSALILGLLALFLLVALQRSHAHNRKIMDQLLQLSKGQTTSV